MAISTLWIMIPYFFSDNMSRVCKCGRSAVFVLNCHSSYPCDVSPALLPTDLTGSSADAVRRWGIGANLDALDVEEGDEEVPPAAAESA